MKGCDYVEDGVWRTIKGRRVFIKTGQSLSDAMKESGKFEKKDLKSNKMEKFTKISVNDGQAKEIGDSLYEVNKFAKELRDARYYNEGHYWGVNTDDEKRYQLIIAKTLGYKEHNDFKKDSSRYDTITRNEISLSLKKREAEIYELKNNVIQKAISEGIQPLGYHEFITTDSRGYKWSNYSKYIKIGNNDFHYDGSDSPPYNMKSLGIIEGMVSSKKIDLNKLDDKIKFLKKYTEDLEN